MTRKSDPETPRPAAGPEKKKPFIPPEKAAVNSMRLRAELQHEEAKMRIFRTFIVLLAICLAGFLVYGVTVWRLEAKEKQARIADAKKTLAELDSALADASLSPYARASILIKRIECRTESLMPLLSRDGAHAADRENTRDAEEIARLAKVEFPAEPGQPGENFVAPSAFLDMVGIPAGTFRMGGSLDWEMPAHEVTISHPFWIARTEVTNRQIRMLIPDFNPAPWGDFRLDLPSQPAVRVRWDQAVMFCRALTERERAAGRLPSNYEYRLPTEAEWEYACRAGTSTDYYWGKEFGNEGAKYANGLDFKSADHEQFGWKLPPASGAADDDGHRVAAPVAQFLPNAWGLYDMSGNAAEWCLDWYDPKAYSAPGMSGKDPYKRDPVNVGFTRYRKFDAGTWTTETACRVIRGGDWGMEPVKLRSAYRFFMPPNESDTAVGFRPVLAHEIENR